MRFEELPSRLRGWIIVQSLLAMATAYWLWSAAPVEDWRLLTFLTLTGVLAGACKVAPSHSNARVSLIFTITVFALLVLGPAAASLVGVAGVVGSLTLRHRNDRWCFLPLKALTHQSLFNLANVVIAVGGMGWAYRAFGGVPVQDVAQIGTAVLPCFIGTAVFYLINGVGVSMALAWSHGKPIGEIFQDCFGWTWVGFAGSASIGVAVLWAYRALPGGLAGLLFLPLAYLVYYSFDVRSQKMRSDIDHMREVNGLNDAMIASLAMAIETKDPHTHKHVHRVREYALGLGRAAGMKGGELEAMRAAALLHDIGKIGIPESILDKRDKLTPEEYDIIKGHVEMGCAILGQVDFPWPVVPIVRSHHERWDGLGYPDGLVGEDIPLGGRILSMVDMYDALTSERPYRRAIPAEQALQIIRSNVGTQFDPRLADLFIETLPSMDAAIAAMSAEAERKGPSLVEVLSKRTAKLQELVTAEMDETAVDAELASLDADDHRMPTFPAQLASRIARLVPCSAFSLFVIDRERQVLVPVHATGQFRHLFEGLEIRVGEGLSGFVAGTGQTVINASASMDLSRRIRPGENLELSSALCVPLEVGGQILGVITLYHSTYNLYQPSHERRLRRVASFLSHSAKYTDWLEASVAPTSDPITGLPTVLSLQQFMHTQLSIAQSREEVFSVLLVSLNVSVNSRGAVDALDSLLAPPDRNRLLIGVSRLLRDCVRDGDQISRAHGSQFVVILPRCGEPEALQISERIQIRSNRLDEMLQGARLAVGCATFPRDGGAGSALLAVAEERMTHRPEQPILALDVPPFAIPGWEAGA